MQSVISTLQNLKTLVFCFLLFIAHMHSHASTCYGTTSNGWLDKGVKLPAKGNNFTGYSWLAQFAGRTYVHSAVRDIVVDAYAMLETEQPQKIFKYAETGLKRGGQFKPHKTHRNGLSVDFMTPVLNDEGKSIHLPTHIFNKLGYNIEFDERNTYKKFTIDFEAIAAHIVALHKASLKRGYDIWRVIFDPKLQHQLFTTPYGSYLKKHDVQFTKKRAWVRHDEHYHVDFAIPCAKTTKVI